MFKQSWKQYISEVTGKEKKMSLMIFTSIHFSQVHTKLSPGASAWIDIFLLDCVKSHKQLRIPVSVIRYCNRSAPNLMVCQRVNQSN